MDINFNSRINGNSTDYSDYDLTNKQSELIIQDIMHDIAKELINQYIKKGYNNFSIDISVSKSEI